MHSQKVSPLIVMPGKSVRRLERLPRVHNTFDERFLQGLVAKHPELLPVHNIRDDIGTLLCIGREVAVPSGAIDNLYLSTEGYPVIVETKLWRNPQARREVLAQTIDYVKDVVKKDYEWFAEQWKRSNQKQGNDASSLFAHLSELADDEIDEQYIIDRVNRALTRGDVIAMIVGDGIETRLQELVNHLCNDSSHLRYSLALVELACYQCGERDDEEILVMPRVVQNIEPVQRAYVRVDVADALQEQVTVTPVVDPIGPDPRPPNLNEEEFLESIKHSAGRKCRDQIQQFYNDLIESFHLDPVFKASTLMLRVPHPDGEHTDASLLGLEKQGHIYNTTHMSHQLKRWGLDPQLIAQITSDYWTALHKIDSRFKLEGIVHQSPRQFIPFSEIADKQQEIKECVGKVAATIREVYENAH